MPAPQPADRFVRRATGLLLAGLCLALAACGKPEARGNVNSLIAVVPDDSLWRQVRDTTVSALEPTVYTVREEKKFYVESVDTASTQDFQQLRTFVQVVLFGTPDNRFVRMAAEEADLETVPPDTIFQVQDLWARNQVVTAVVLDPERPAESWRAHLSELIGMIDRQYRRFARQRMYVSGVDSVAADSLRDRFGFNLAFPRVYDVAVMNEGEGPVVVRNDNPDPSDLIRSVLIDWRSPPLDTLTAAAAYRWRAELDSLYYNVPQAIDTSRAETRRLRGDGPPALEATGVWSDEGTGFPAGGPFFVRLVNCPDRTYLIDAWLYAPGKDKYQYMFQLEEIVDSFSCGTGDAPAAGSEN